MNPSSTSEYLSILTLDQLRTLCHGMLKLPCSIGSQKSKIIDAIEGSGMQELQMAAFEAAKMKYDEKSDKKHKWEEVQFTRRVARKLEEGEPSSWENPHDITNFLDLPSDQEVKQCYHDFRLNSQLRCAFVVSVGVKLVFR